MKSVRAKKSLGQHFLKDVSIALQVAESLYADGCDSVLEIGPGTGILTRPLMMRGFRDFRVVEIDRESVAYLRHNFPGLNIIEGDFLKLDIDKIFRGTIAVTGNFPYNISAPILFRMLEHRDRIKELTGMFQREVAQRICAGPGSKTYGILSVLIQAFYTAEYLFTVPEHLFFPPPKVKSGVIRLIRNDTLSLECDEDLFFRVVKTCFNQRRKIIRNSLGSVFSLREEHNQLFQLRPEQLTVQQFVSLTRWVSENIKSE